MTADPQPQLSVPIQTPSKCASTGAGVNSVDDGIDRVHRTIHLSGGRRAHSLVDGRVLLDPFKDGLGPIEIKADSYYGVFDQLHKLGLPVIGVDFQITELDGQHPRPSS